MISLTLNDKPALTINGETYHGINIIDQLHKAMEHSEEARKLFVQAANVFQLPTIPRIGFRLEHPSAVMPTKRIIDVGYDLTVVDVCKQLTPLTTMFETYVSLDIPLGYYVELVPRSSLSKTGYMLANSVGVIDPCFTGTLKVPLIKVDPNVDDLKLPARVAQLILKPYVISEAYDATDSEIIETERGNGGFGSTN